MSLTFLRPLETLNPYEQAQRLGWAAYRHTGQLILPELVITSTLRCLRTPEGKPRARYDNGHPNLRRHILILGDRDMKKGSCVDLWKDRIIKAQNYADPNADRRNGIIMGEAQGGSRFESYRGGSSNGRLVLPTILFLDVLNVPELMAWLGHDPKSMMTTVEQLNASLQDGRLTVDLVKMKGLPAKQIAEFAARCEELGILFNPTLGVMHYETDYVLVACSREPPAKLWKDMLLSGVVSRLAIVDLHMDEETMDAYRRDQFGPGDPEALASLRAFHEYAWACRFKRIDVPHDLVRDVNDAIEAEYRHISELVGRSRREFTVGREMQNIAQLLTFSAVQRTLRARMLFDRPPGLIPPLEYTKADAEFALGHFKRYTLPLTLRWAEKGLRSDGKADPIFEEAVDILSKWAKSIQKVDSRTAEDIEQGVHPDTDFDPVQTFKSGDFYRFYCLHKKISNPTYQARLALLIERNHLLRVSHEGRNQVYKIPDSAMESFGLQSMRQLVASLPPMEDEGESQRDDG